MIWFNKNKTRRIDLSHVVAYNYVSAAKRMIDAQNSIAGLNRGSSLDLVLSGGGMIIEGQEADEIYGELKKIDNL